MESVLYFVSINMTTVIMVLIGFLIIALFALTVYDILIRKNEAKQEVLEDFTDEFSGSENFHENYPPEPVDVKAPINEIKYVEEDPELEKTKAKLELEKLKEELAKQNAGPAEALDVPLATKEETIVKEEVAPVLETFSPLVIDSGKKAAEDFDDIKAFEDKQEEDAIISMDELSKVIKTRTIENTSYEEDESMPISIDELYQKSGKASIKLDDFETIDEKISIEDVVDPLRMPRAENVSIISPIFGRLDEEIDLKLENTADLDKLNEEIKKTNEFLKTLKELKSKLN